MNDLLSTLNKTILSRIPDKHDNELIRKVILLNGITTVGIIFLIILGVIAFIQNSYTLGALDFLSALLLIAVLVFMYRTLNFIASCYIGVTLMYLFYLYLFISGGVNSTAFMWLFTFPLFSLFLLGAKAGTIATTLLFIPSVLFLIFDLYSAHIQVYTLDFALRFIPSYLTVFLFSFMYEKTRENAQRKLKKVNEDQERIIEDRTAQLKQEIEIKEEFSKKLRQSQQMRAIGLMAGGVAHDLNNILSGIVSYPEILLTKMPPDSEFREPLEAIRDSGKRSAAVVADLLTVARGIRSKKEIYNVNDIITDYMHSPEFRIMESRYPHITFIKRLDPKLLNIKCSPVHIRKSIMNIIVNASEAINEIGIVTISTRNMDIDISLAQQNNLEIGTYVVFTVEDTGGGISDSDKEHIFEPFYSKKIMGRSGTGLGLAVAWNTVKDHNGGISVESSDKGTVFSLYFPSTSEEIPVSNNPLHTKNFLGNGENILIVDDEPMQLDIASQIVTSLGYTAQCVSSGEEAIDYLNKHSVQLVLLDMIMDPGMSGRETYEEIIKIHPGQAAIIASGFSRNKDVEDAMQLGVKTFINKPYSIVELGRTIQEILLNE
ncbi:response regulator [Candidatus Omnitrophota bacterium]